MIDKERFKDRLTEKLFYGQSIKTFRGKLRQTVQDKLKLVYAAAKLESLAIPPGNRLEKLTGVRKGCYSIRINDQWRICFRWENGMTKDIEVVDYH